MFGSGKTLSAVYECYKYYRKGFTVYSNIHLSFPYIPLTKELVMGMAEQKTSIRDAVVLIDEAHIYLDSRNSMKKFNKAFSYWILQSRKRSMRIIVTTQHMAQVDVRMRNTVDILCHCTNMSNKSSVVSKNPSLPVYILQESVFQWKEEMKPMKKMLYANPVFSLFDTEQLVEFEGGTDE